MVDKLKELLNKVLEWWNKFSAKQKTFIISAGAGVILALAILITVLTRPQYTLLRDCETTRKHLKSQKFWMQKDWITRFLMMRIGLPLIRNSFRRQTCCLHQITFRQMHTPSIMLQAVDSVRPKQINREDMNCIWKLVWHRICWRVFRS